MGSLGSCEDLSGSRKTVVVAHKVSTVGSFGNDESCNPGIDTELTAPASGSCASTEKLSTVGSSGYEPSDISLVPAPASGSCASTEKVSTVGSSGYESSAISLGTKPVKTLLSL